MATIPSPADGALIAAHELSLTPSGGGQVPLVVLHGGPDWDHRYLLPGLQPLARRRRVVAVDLRGCGASQRGLPPGSHRVDRAVTDLLAVADHVAGAGGRIDLLGFSFGGIVAQRFAAAHPHRLRSLVLASTSAYGHERQSRYLAQSLDRLARAAQVPPREWPEPHVDPVDAAALTRQWAVEQACLDVWDESLLPAYIRLLDDVDFSGEWLADVVRQAPRDITSGGDGADLLERLSLPLLVLHGEKDLTFPLPLAEELARQVPGAVLAVVPGAGHMAQFERPEAWSASIDTFLSDLDRADA